MDSRRSSTLIVGFAFVLGCVVAAGCAPSPQPPSETAGVDASAVDPLPSWNDGPAKQSILDFVGRVTDPASVDFVPEPERIAVFDNDGTLWSEQPMYFQVFFSINRVREMAADHSEWREQQPFKAVIEGDLEALKAAGEHGLVEIIAATHTGMTTAEFQKSVRRWISTARHPTTGRLYTEMVFQPMLEVLDLLRSNAFKVFIVSGGGIDFVRVWAEDVYGIPPEQVVGSSVVTKFEMRDDSPVLVRLPEIDFVDDKAGKPVGIDRHIGRRPIAAFGNSDGDLQMLQWTTAGDGVRLGVIIRHTDAEREWAYDRGSHIGGLDAALNEAPTRGWAVVDMARDWKVIYPFELDGES
jgi:phosphoglycolate phosphatase-like HAD superfamily hydrolase